MGVAATPAPPAKPPNAPNAAANSSVIEPLVSTTMCRFWPDGQLGRSMPRPWNGAGSCRTLGNWKTKAEGPGLGTSS
jgi:hypothetical protein